MVGDMSDLDPWTAGSWKLKEALHQKQLVDITHQDVWKVEYLKSLLGKLHVAKQLVQEDLSMNKSSCSQYTGQSRYLMWMKLEDQVFNTLLI